VFGERMMALEGWSVVLVVMVVVTVAVIARKGVGER